MVGWLVGFDSSVSNDYCMLPMIQAWIESIMSFLNGRFDLVNCSIVSKHVLIIHCRLSVQLSNKGVL
jgi:hypothetical protein